MIITRMSIMYFRHVRAMTIYIFLFWIDEIQQYLKILLLKYCVILDKITNNSNSFNEEYSIIFIMSRGKVCKIHLTGCST